MNDEAVLQSINNSVLELSVSGNTAWGLNVMLEKLLVELSRAHVLPLEQRCVMVLANSQGKFFQVAQAGMEPAWNANTFWRSPTFENAVAFKGGVIQACLFDDPAAQGEKRQLLLLPLSEESKRIGYLVLFAPAAYQPSLAHIDFYTGLAHAISGFVQRTQTRKIQQVYKYALEDAHVQAIQSLGVASEYRDSETSVSPISCGCA